MSRGSIMGSKVFMTYKRKRLFSGSDHSHLDLHSDDTHPEISVSKSSANFDDHEKPMCEHTLLNKGTDTGIQHEYSLKNGGESMVQCENCDSQYQDQCSEEHTPKLQSLYSISKCNSSEQKRISENSDGKQITFPPDVTEVVSAEGKSSDDPSKPLFMKLDTEHLSDDEKFQASSSPDAYSPMESDTVLPQMSDRINEKRQMDTLSGAYTSEETSKVNKDGDGSLCNDSVAYWKLATSLITYQRKPKRKRNISALEIASETQLACNSLITLKDGKKSSEDNNNSSTPPIPGLGVETPHLAAASRNIDCNIPLDSVFDENHPPGPSVVLPSSTSKSNRNMQAVQAQCRDKGKAVVDSSPALAAASSKNKYLQLFPESSISDALRLSNDREKTRGAHQASYHPTYPLPGFQVHPHPRETFHDFLALTPDQAQSFSSQKMMLDNFLNRARGARVGGNFLPENFRPPTIWSEGELDCLWIGVRRHGRGNWGAMLRDRRLQFSAWRTPWELAEKWREEQSRVFPITPVSQPKFLNSFLPNVPIDEVQLSLGNPYAGPNWGIPNRPQFFHPMGIPNHQPVAISGPLSAYGYCNPSGGVMTGKGHLPHWLREAVGAPSMLPNSTDCCRNGQGNGYTSINEGETETVIVRNRGNVGRKRGKVTMPEIGLIVIPSDASSEETISDDRNGRA